jgi:hypothetical protein
MPDNATKHFWRSATHRGYVRPNMSDARDADVFIPSDYDDLVALSHETNRRLDGVYAMEGISDPWMAGRPARQANARWFVDQYNRLGFKTGVHLRRIHYVLVSQAEPVVMIDGGKYENTEKCFSVLVRGARDARYLEMLPSLAFRDHRSPDALIVRKDIHDDETTSIDVSEGKVTGGGMSLTYEGPSLELPILLLDSPIIGQPYHLEIWCEKTTMDDVLHPLGERYNCNVVSGAGEMSLTTVEQFAARARASMRPVRVLYVSDFDPAGQSMPVAVARKIEYLIRNEELDIQLEPVALTHQQCIDFRLPRTPIKETEHRAGAFEARYGEGATELDALEALHPGALRRILIENIERFHDSDLHREIDAVEDAIRSDMWSVESEVRAQHTEEINAIEVERKALEQEVEEKLAEVRALIDEREDALTERIEALLETICDELEDAKPDIDDYEWPSPADGSEFDDPLFDSQRCYLDQIDRYARFKGKEIAVRQQAGWKAKAYGERHAVDRAADAIKASPEKSTREIAEELGIPMHTVRRARRKSVDNPPDPQISGNDKDRSARRSAGRG